MTELEKKYFEKLRLKCAKLSESLNDPMVSGVKETISNLYREKAHFIYELLQNADDQGATTASFILNSDNLIFTHDAPRHFSISDPDTHEEDKKNGKLGDVNSILSIGSSSKNNNEAEIKIGKFGLGFKSVFQYTDCPEIYDDNIRFSITDHILPDYIAQDHPQRKPGKTLFLFKFKKGEEETAHGEIEERLKELANPLLFLNHLNIIEWKSETNDGLYLLENIGKIGSGYKFRYEALINGKGTQSEMWKFNRSIDGLEKLAVSVVYPIVDGKLTPESHPLYCYLPTAIQTDLPVICHAPFKLTGNRESIVAKDPHNISLINDLGDLLVSSLKEICEIGQALQTPWINENILNFIPKDNTSGNENKTSIDISPLFEKIDIAMKSIPMLWCEDFKEYLIRDEARTVENRYLPQIYSSEMISKIFGGKCGWVLTSLYSKFKETDSTTKAIGAETLTPEKILRRITPAFLEKQTFEWLCEWYKSLLQVPKLWESGNDPFLRYKDIILTSKGMYIAPYSKENKSPNLLLPKEEHESSDLTDLKFVDSRLLEYEEVKNFLIRLGIKEIDQFTYAERVLIPVITSESKPFEERLRALVDFARIYVSKLNNEQQKDLNDKCYIPVFLNNSWKFLSIEKVKLHNELNDFYFNNNPEITFFEPGNLIPFISEDDIEILKNYVNLFPVAKAPIIKIEKIAVTENNSNDIPADARRPAWYNRSKIECEYFEMPYIEGISHFIDHVAPVNPRKASDILVELVDPDFISTYYCSLYYGNLCKSSPIEPSYFNELRQAPWIGAATNQLKELIGIPIKELNQENIENLKEILSESGIVSGEEMENFIQYITQQGILDNFRLKQEIENLKEVVKASKPFSLKWLDDILELRMKYVEAGEKEDIDFLISSLKMALEELTIDRDTDLRDVLPDNLNIIFGPPGTGKTTKITQLIKETVSRNPQSKILVLTPTNASAKVVAQRLNQKQITAYRGVNPKNKDAILELENSGIPIFNSNEDEVPNILISTIHYFSRTFAIKENTYIHDIEWDEIFIDESSMVTLDYMLFALLKGHQNNPDCKFYVVGDPLQLPAITNLDPFILEEAQLDEFNFYSFIGLDEFSENPSKLYPALVGKVNIHLLKKQYRSVEPLCRLMSNFAYNGMVESEFKGQALILPATSLSIFQKPLSFVRFPVTKLPNNLDDSKITDLNKLKNSNFNIYSALLINASLNHLLETLNKEGTDTPVSIGIITSYVAQKKLIEKLLNSGNLSRNTNIEILVNTVHQFQGDEFDIVMLVLNPPNVKMHPADNILINKHYLINVGTSRAKNNLVIFYPDETCETSNFIHINKNSGHRNIEQIAEEIFSCDIRKISQSSVTLEQEIFGRKNYLSEISDIKYHEEVNYHNPPVSGGYRFVIGGTTIDIIHTPK